MRDEQTADALAAYNINKRPLVAAIPAIAAVDAHTPDTLEHCAACLYNVSCLPEGR